MWGALALREIFFQAAQRTHRHPEPRATAMHRCDVQINADVGQHINATGCVSFSIERQSSPINYEIRQWTAHNVAAAANVLHGPAHKCDQMLRCQFCGGLHFCECVRRA